MFIYLSKYLSIYPSADISCQRKIFFIIKSTFSKASQKLNSILLFEYIEYQVPLAQLVSTLAQETKTVYVRVRILAEFFLVRSNFLVFFIDNSWDYLFCSMVISGIKMTVIKFPIE